MPGLMSCIPFPIDEITLNDLVPKAKDWALLHGAALRSTVNHSKCSLQVCAKSHMQLDWLLISIVIMTKRDHFNFVQEKNKNF